MKKTDRIHVTFHIKDLAGEPVRYAILCKDEKEAQAIADDARKRFETFYLYINRCGKLPKNAHKIIASGYPFLIGK